MHRAVVLAGAAALAVALSGCAGVRSGAGAAPSPTAAVSTPAPLTTGSAESITIGALPKRPSLLLHGRAPLPSLDPAMEQDLTTLAKGEGRDPDVVIDEYAAQPAFDEAVQTVEGAHVGYADAVFRPGENGASELRFTRRPPHRLLEELERTYPRDLLITWGEHLAGDDDRDAMSGLVIEVVARVHGVQHPSTGFDADGRLTVEYDGTATPREVADAILRDAAFLATYVDGVPPTEVRVTRVADNEVSTF